MEFDVKKLKVIAIILSGVILAIFLYLLFTSESALDKKKVKEKNIYKAQNNNSFIVQYGDYLYYIPEVEEDLKTNYKYISKAPTSDVTSPVIGEEAIELNNLKLESKIIIYANKIFFIQNGNTYKCTVSSKTPEAFCDGVIQYIDEYKAISLVEGNLYKVPYYEATFLPQKYQKIVIGNLIFFGEDDEMLYYYSTNDAKKTTLIGINKNDLSVATYEEKIKEEIKLIEMISTKKYLFYLAIENDVPYIMRISKKDYAKEKIELTDYTDVSIFKNDTKNNIYFFGSKSFGNIKKYVCKESELIPTEFDGIVASEYIENYTVDYSGNLIKLYKQGVLFTTIKVDVDELTAVRITDIVKIDDSIYCKIYYTNSKNLKVTEDMYYNRPINPETVTNSSGDIEQSKTKTDIFRISVDGENVQKLVHIAK